jgi:transcriptional regulator with XRE-family HTH domain
MRKKQTRQPAEEHPLKIWRTVTSTSQYELGLRLGVTNITISRWETGLRKIDASLVPRVSKITGIPPKSLRPDLAQLLEVA